MKKQYKCRFCGKPHATAYMADICFQLDLKLQEKAKRNLVPLNSKEKHESK